MKPNLQQLIKKLKLNYCNSSIIESNFPTISKGKVTKIFEFESSYTTQEAKEKLKNEGYRPATPRELLNWAKDNWNGKDNVVALGQEWLDANGLPGVVCLWSRAGLRELGLFWADSRWNSNTRVAGVRVVSESSDTKTLSSSNLDSLTLRVKVLEDKFNKIKELL